MSIKIGKYTFKGTYTSTERLEDRSGVYAIVCKKDKLSLIDVGESAKVKTRVETHERKDCWEKNCQGTLLYAVHYTPNLHQQGRKEIEKEIRKEYNPPCGEI